jgi:hypothetical protein
VHVNWNAAPVIDTADSTVGKNRDLNEGTVAGKSLIDGVVNDFVDKVVQAALAGGPDVHSGTLSNGLQAFENLDIFGPVIVGVCLRF